MAKIATATAPMANPTVPAMLKAPRGHDAVGEVVDMPAAG